MNGYVEEYAYQINLIMRMIMNKNFKLLTASFIIALTLATPQLTHATCENLDALPVELKSIIIKRAATDQCSDGEGPLNLALVCKSWRDIVNEDVNKQGPIWKAWYGILGNEAIFQRFFNGVLQYRPDPTNNDDMVTLYFSHFKKNLFNGTFGRPECVAAADMPLVTTSLSDFFAPHPDQVVIGFFPHFRAERIVASTPNHPFKAIMGNWDKNIAPVGIFWRWGSWNDLTWYDYLTQSSLADISSRDLYGNWVRAIRAAQHTRNRTHYVMHYTQTTLTPPISQYVSCLFLN